MQLGSYWLVAEVRGRRKILTDGWQLSFPVYNILLHPLRSYTGPWYSRVSRLWCFVKALQGVLPYEVKSLHDKYGPIVRIAPDELSYNCAEAWQDIYGNDLTTALLFI
jgi:hypothetical protein